MSFEDEARTRWFLDQILPHEPALRSWLSQKRASGIDVDDVIQESYAVLYSLKSVDDIRFPRAYLFRVAHSVIVKYVRRSLVVPIQAAEDLEALSIPDEGATPEETAIVRDELRQLARVIAAMPGRTREAFILRRVHGLSQREVAREMRLSESTVEKHIARGIRFLIDWAGHGGKRTLPNSKKEEVKSGSRNGRARNQSDY